MFPLVLTNAQQEKFEDALRGADRYLRFRARLLHKDHTPTSYDLEVVDGEVIFDCTNEDEPTRTAHATLNNEGNRLGAEFFFDKMIRLTWGIWVQEMDEWVDVPVFTGPIQETNEVEGTIEVSAAGKESEHLPPCVFFDSFSVRKNVRLDRAIRAIFLERDETHLDIEATQRRLPKGRSWGIGVVPWIVAQRIADSANNKQLFFRGDGTLRLRAIPDRAVFKFHGGQARIVLGEPEQRRSIIGLFNAFVIRGQRADKQEITSDTTLTEKADIGDTQIKVASAKNLDTGRKVEIGTKTPDVRTISGSYTPGSLTVPFTRALEFKHPEGAKVSTRFKKDVTRRVVARERLPGTHPYSAQNLGSGKRPRVKVIDRGSIHKREQAQEVASSHADKAKVGLDSDVAMEVLTVPHLEELDLIHVDIGGIEKRVRMRKWSLPLNYSSTMPVNWHGKDLPKGRHGR